MNYWPLPITTTTHLDILRIYRNALSRLTSHEQHISDEARHQEWVEKNQDRQRQRGGFRDARVDSYLPGEMEMANYNQVAEWEGEQRKEEERRVAAEVQEISDALYDRERQEIEDREMARKLQEDEDANHMPPLISYHCQPFAAETDSTLLKAQRDRNAGMRQVLADKRLAQAVHASENYPDLHRTRQSIIPKLVRRPRTDTRMAPKLSIDLYTPYLSISAEETVSDLSAEHAHCEDKKRKTKDDDGA
jgi:hypothetical protein